MIGVIVCHPCIAFVLVTVLVLSQISPCFGTEGELKTLDVAKLSKLEHGTELVLIENGLNDKKAYRLEDFFWTGSGDGSPDDYGNDPSSQWVSETTLYKTKTVLSTIYLETPSTTNNQLLPEQTTNCPINCDSPVTPDDEIVPTPTYQPTFYPNATEEDSPEADRHFWLLTVLRSDGKDPVITDLKNSLAKLYKTAFQRQQEKHLGINSRPKREAEEEEKIVNVYIHHVAKTPINGKEKIEVLYHVSVSGHPVAATTAAADMNLVSDDEVTNELGYPFIIKAEPYIKVNDPQYLAKTNNTWVFIGVALTILFVLLLLVALLTLAMSKSNSKSPIGLANRQQALQRHNLGMVSRPNNKSYVSSEVQKKEYQSGRRNQSPTYINFRSQPSNQTLRSGIVVNRPQSASSSSSYSASSLDISPLMREKHQKTPPRKITLPRPKGAMNKTAPLKDERRASLGLDSDSSTDQTRRDSSDTILIKNYDPGVVSPKSYLSMPSVKSFPRGNIPEPLSKVLEPVSVLHLDIEDDEDVPDVVEQRTNRIFTRHGSMGAVEDPGVIGPMVWNAHCKRLEHEPQRLTTKLKPTGVSVDEGIDDMKIANNASRMRKRFHDLLDETFSLFGSQRQSPVDDGRAMPVEIKSHSALNNRPSDEIPPDTRPRPKTSDPRRPLPRSEPPRGAWTSKAPSPMGGRPLSAAPHVDVNRVLAEGNLHPNDPAVPLIAAIKTELGKCSLPGSTANLAE